MKFFLTTEAEYLRSPAVQDSLREGMDKPSCSFAAVAALAWLAQAAVLAEWPAGAGQSKPLDVSSSVVLFGSPV